MQPAPLRSILILTSLSLMLPMMMLMFWLVGLTRLLTDPDRLTAQCKQRFTHRCNSMFRCPLPLDALAANEDCFEVTSACKAQKSAVWWPNVRKSRPNAEHWNRFLWQEMQRALSPPRRSRERRVALPLQGFSPCLARNSEIGVGVVTKWPMT